ncbi:MAG: LamG-like jellyroll fold domain-containing protein [Planctomycetota bacterium]|jgi:hypothetical protein
MCKKLTHLTLVLVLVLLADVASADITTGLVGYWNFDGNANDSSGNNVESTEYGNPVYVPGVIGEAIEFDGSGQQVHITGFSAIQNQDEMTVCMWAKADNPSGGQQVMWFTNEDGSYGRIRFRLNGGDWQWRSGGSGSNITAGGPPATGGQWVHLVGTRKNNDKLELFVNGVSVATEPFGVAGAPRDQSAIGAEGRNPTDPRLPFDGAIDEVRVYNRILSADDIQELYAYKGGSPAAASDPDPADEQTDVPRDVVLNWTPGDFAPAINGHKIYVGEVFADVNDGIGGITQSADSYTPEQRFDFGTTYYWRVDEVNGPPDYTVHEGSVWSFTTEPVGYPIANVTATASSRAPNQGPENATVDGSGLSDDLHSTETQTMWLSEFGGPQPTWIQYEFDNVYKLHEMWVWNSNTELELSVGFGFKDVTIEYSIDGTDYMTLGTTHEFARAPGADGYAHNTTVDLGGLQARYVRLTANSSWGGFLPQFGLSEVRFFHIPVRSREPHPEPGATDVDVDVTLSWRAGREAAEHDVYLSTDEQAVTDGTAGAGTVIETSYGTLLDMDTTYYWRIDEVNDAETPATLPGNVWSFSTQEFRVVDDFESYNDIAAGEEGSNLVYSTWVDGFDNPSANGSAMGYIVPFEPTMESGNRHGGDQSAPLLYDNGTAPLSEVTANTANLPIGRDWTLGSPQTLVLWFHGNPGNAISERLYVKVNNAKVTYPGDPANLAKVRWTQWNIDLASLGIDLTNVTQMSIGLERTGGFGGAGTVLIDDIRLYQKAPEIVLSSEEIWIEAEAADTITAPMLTYDDPLASGGKYIGTTDDVGNSSDSPPPDGIATYSFTVQGGIYKVAGRVIIPSGDSFWVRIPGAADLTPGEDPDNPGTGWVRWSDPPNGNYWHWDDVFSGDHDGQTANWTLPAGTYTLEIARREDGALLDIIVISKVD